MISLFQEDCLKVLPTLPSGSVDLLLTDLPYGTTQNKWDTPLPLSTLWKELLRVGKKKAAFVFTAQTPFDKVLGCSNLPLLRYEWIWKKNVSTGFLNAKRAPLKIHENVLVFYQEPPTYNPQFSKGTPYVQKRSGIDDTGDNYGKIKKRTSTVNDGRRYPNSVLAFDREIGLHPTQKPIALMDYLIRTYTNEGETVLDVCMGSGSTGVAAVCAQRSFIGIEIEEKYFSSAKERIHLSEWEAPL